MNLLFMLKRINEQKNYLILGKWLKLNLIKKYELEKKKILLINLQKNEDINYF
jgi:hypothetical protein